MTQPPPHGVPESVGTSGMSCGNPHHPDGAWHPATPLPYPGLRAWVEYRRQRIRTKAWGCPCESRRPDFERDVGAILLVEIIGVALALATGVACLVALTMRFLP